MFAPATVPLERRRDARMPVTLTAHCQIGSRYVRDMLSDISLGGLFMRTDEPASDGSAVRVALALPYADGLRFCTLTGTVVRTAREAGGRRAGVAIAFDDESDPFDREMLRGFLALWGARRVARA